MPHLRICCDLAQPFLPMGIKDSIASSLRLLAMLQCGSLRQPAAAAEEYAPDDDGDYMDYSDCHNTLAILLAASKDGIICNLCYLADGDKSPRRMFFAPARLVAQKNGLHVIGSELKENFADMRGIIKLSVRGITNIELTDRKCWFNSAIESHAI